MHQNSLQLFINHGLPLIKQYDEVLEVGPDWYIQGGLVKPLLENAGACYHFTDIVPRNSHLRGYVSMNGEYAIDAPNESYDVVVTLNVIEHVRDIWEWVGELKRVTRVNGLLIFVNPVSWPYHPSPYDCWRILPEGYKALFESLGIEMVDSFVGNVVPLEDSLRAEHGPHEVVDTVAVGRRYV